MLLNEFELTLEYQRNERAINDLMLENNIAHDEASILYYELERVHIKIKSTSFRQILTTTALKIFDGCQPMHY